MAIRNGRQEGIPREGKLNQLLKEVLAYRLQPEDHYEIAAILESHGWNDVRAAEEFGAENVFDLASNLWDIVSNNLAAEGFSPQKDNAPLAVLGRMIRNFLRGMIFALPMAVSIAAMLTLRFSLWSYEYLTLESATAIAIGTIISFLSVGGFIQAIARRGFLYIKQGFYNLARRITYYFIRMGLLACLLLALVMLVLNSFLGVFPFRMIIVTALYFIFLNAIWLSVSVMYILQKEIAFTGLMIAGIFIVYLLFEVFNYNIIISQLIALAIVAATGVFIAIRFFRSAEEKMDKGIAPALSRASITIYTIGPYFLYGAMYFLFLFADRIIAWSTNDIYMPYFIWFRGPYELGLDFATLGFILPMGVIEVVVNEIMVGLEDAMNTYPISECAILYDRYKRIYLRRLLAVSLISLLNTVLLFLLIKYVSNGGFGFGYNLIANNTTYFVFVWALAGYAFLVAALMNVMILFSFSQPAMASKPLYIAIAVNIVVGFLASRWFDYSFAVLGLAAGSAVFTVLTSRNVLVIMRKLDYYLSAMT